MEDKDISSILVSELKDHPLLLTPLPYRQKLLRELLSFDQKFFQALEKSYLYLGDLSKKNRMIYDALLKSYRGKHKDVLRHIRVERFEISKRYSTGAVTIEPRSTSTPKCTKSPWTSGWRTCPRASIAQPFRHEGGGGHGQPGVLEYSDLLKRPLDTYKYLLMTMETKNINLQGILTELDIFFLGTSNEVHFSAFKQHPDFNSFKGRCNFIRVPYLLDYRQEKRIYSAQIGGLGGKCRFGAARPAGAVPVSVMTRLRCPQGKNYGDKKLARVATALDPFEKALFMATGKAPDRFDLESQQILANGIDEVRSEFELENLLRGEIRDFPQGREKHPLQGFRRVRHVTFLEIAEYLQKLVLKKNDYDFLNMTPQGDYHHPARFISLVKDHCLDIFDKELRESLGMGGQPLLRGLYPALHRKHKGLDEGRKD